MDREMEGFDLDDVGIAISGWGRKWSKELDRQIWTMDDVAVCVAKARIEERRALAYKLKTLLRELWNDATPDGRPVTSQPESQDRT